MHPSFKQSTLAVAIMVGANLVSSNVYAIICASTSCGGGYGGGYGGDYINAGRDGCGGSGGSGGMDSSDGSVNCDNPTADTSPYSVTQGSDFVDSGSWGGGFDSFDNSGSGDSSSFNNSSSFDSGVSSFDSGWGGGDMGWTSVGDPINAATGNKYAREWDYRGSGPLSLQFQRYYNSAQTSVATELGAGWRSTYDSSISYVGGQSTATVIRPDGKNITFALSGVQWKNPQK